MKTTILITLLLLSFVGYGQNKLSTSGYLPTTKDNIQKDTTYPMVISGTLYETNKLYYPDNFFISQNDVLRCFPNDINSAKATITKTGFTLFLDQFKVTDTVWIIAGKRKAGIPAYKFLEYFKDEPKYQLHENGRMNLNLFDHIIPANEIKNDYK